MWYKENEQEMYAKIYKILGTKDYCNFRLTGKIYTDHSYASGTGAYSLKTSDYATEYMENARINPAVFPEIIRSYDVIGTLTPEASALIGLPEHVKVVCGGVDNSCMALGARGIESRPRIYLALVHPRGSR